ncbi:hypothetical protein [Vibrio agarivorans]|uniref:hypothetical protein n=1 Tax=Vibrio agarivorans TaxID=153622 RepID=UPI0022311CEF|nr:hypothetical protein [Vibrio agarivorans]
MRQKQTGAAVLFVVSALLLVVLIMVLGSYKSLYFQIKRANNHIEARQVHWLAEGGLECGWAQFKVQRSVPLNITDCDTGFGVFPTFIASSYGYRVSSSAGYKSLHKAILLSGSLDFGAMQSSADIYFNSSATFSTPDPGLLGTDGWECIALRYKNRFYSAVSDNKGIIHGEPPYTNFTNPTNQDCANTSANNHMTSVLSGVGGGKDFLKDSDVTPFESYFGVKSEKHNEVRDNGVFNIISAAGAQCGIALIDAIQAGHHHLWVEGHCEIKITDYNNLVDATQSTDGVTVLVHDGLFSIMGAPSSGASDNKFKGVLFHFNYDYTPTPADWSGFDANNHLHHSSSVVEASYRTIASYYQHGSFTVSGGQYFDSTDQAAVFFDSLDFRYNKDIIDNSRSAFITPRWQRGSWHDL